jgi:hypothetical protein
MHYIDDFYDDEYVVSHVALDFYDNHLTSTDKLYSGGPKPIYSGVFRNRQC